jgi:voltage-gated potassium channel Kch
VTGPANGPVLVIGSGHLAHRIATLVALRGRDVLRLQTDLSFDRRASDAASTILTNALAGRPPASLGAVFIVNDQDDQNLALLIALMAMDRSVPIVVSFFNENVAPHLQAAHPEIHVLNPAKIAAAAFVDALETPLVSTLRYTPARIAEDPPVDPSDHLIRRLLYTFAGVVALAVGFFHFAEGLTWLNSVYFVVVTVATVGYGDISLANSGAASKIAGIALILTSTVFIWMIFSLTVDDIIKRRVQRALGRRRYAMKGHIILSGLGRLGYFVAEGLLARGEKVLIIEQNVESTTVEHFRAMGAEVYLGDARRPRVLQDAGVRHARALFALVDNDFINLEIGLNARSCAPNLRLVLRIYDEATSRRIKEHLDIHLTFSMSAIVDEHFVERVIPAA